ncbi:MAG TPA: S9 family peptidase [Candidatus Limnocylindria bacterium]|nr:S9 family peptidase [Candidatus Limnocylindria bacterium]
MMRYCVYLAMLFCFAAQTVCAPLIPHAVLFGNPEKVVPQLSPDGTKLAYLAPYNGVINVWVRTVGKDDDRVITADTHRGIRTYLWARDNSSLLYVQDKNGDENWRLFSVSSETKQVIDLTPYKDVQVQLVKSSSEKPNELLIGLNKDNKRLHDLYRLDITTGVITLVAKNPGDSVEWHADSSLQLRAATALLPDGSMEVRLYDNQAKTWQSFITWDFDAASNSSVLGFSRDGTIIYLRDSSDTDTACLVSMDITTGAKKVLAYDVAYDVSELVVHPQTHEPVAALFQKERAEYVVLDAVYQQDFAMLKTVDRGDPYLVSYDDTFTIWIVTYRRDNGPIAYYLYDRTTKKAELLFESSKALAQYDLASTKPISFTSRDGLTMHGYLTQPIGITRAPLVLLVHGGPWLRDQWGYNPEVQWLVNRGYSCLQINYRGSIGYGKAFINAGNKEWGGKMHNDLVDGVTWAIANGYADADKVAIFGMSYGGYAALVGATFTPDLFCCAVDMVGISNLATFLNSIPPYWATWLARLKRRIGDPVTEAALLRSRSPLFFVHAIKKPLFIAQGGTDPRVKQTESEQIVAALQERGIAHEYMLFPDEGHIFVRPENKLKLYAALEKFLHTHLGGSAFAKASADRLQ